MPALQPAQKPRLLGYCISCSIYPLVILRPVLGSACMNCPESPYFRVKYDGYKNRIFRNPNVQYAKIGSVLRLDTWMKIVIAPCNPQHHTNRRQGLQPENLQGGIPCNCDSTTTTPPQAHTFTGNIPGTDSYCACYPDKKTRQLVGRPDFRPPPHLPRTGRGRPSSYPVHHHTPLQGQGPCSHGIGLPSGRQSHELPHPPHLPLLRSHGVGFDLIHQRPQQSGVRVQRLHVPRPLPLRRLWAALLTRQWDDVLGDNTFNYFFHPYGEVEGRPHQNLGCRLESD